MVLWMVRSATLSTLASFDCSKTGSFAITFSLYGAIVVGTKALGNFPTPDKVSELEEHSSSRLAPLQNLLLVSFTTFCKFDFLDINCYSLPLIRF